MQVLVTKIDSVEEPAGASTLTVVKVGDHMVVANKKEDGSWRWHPGELCVYVPEGAIVPQDVLQERGYWEEGARKGLLAGSKGNRVKGRVFAKNEDGSGGFPSEGLLFKVNAPAGDVVGHDQDHLYWVDRGAETLGVNVGDDVAEFLGITEHVA